MEDYFARASMARIRRQERKEKLKFNRQNRPCLMKKVSRRRGLYRSRAGLKLINQQEKVLENRCVSDSLMNEIVGVEYYEESDQTYYIRYRDIENQGYMDIGDMDVTCCDCGALIWYDERAGKSRGTSNIKVSFCCKRGKITIPLMKQPPVLIRSLFDGTHPKSSHFMSNIRSYNNMFSFTSMGGKIQSTVNNGGGPPQFVVSGQNYHLIGSLIPNYGTTPKFAQLYIYDTDNEVANRVSHFSALESPCKIDQELVRDILEVLDKNNVLVKSFRMVRDYIQQNDSVQVSLRLFRKRHGDLRTYNVPDVDEVAALVVGDIGDDEEGRDIIVRSRGGFLKRIHETHTKYIPLQYPLLFPFGEDQYDENIKLNYLTTTRTKKKRLRVSLRAFIAYRIQQRSLEDSLLHKSKRLFQQFVVDLYSMVESQRLSWIRNNQTKIRADFLQGIEEAVGRGDTIASSIGSRIVLPSSFTGGRRYMFNNCQDAMAMCKKFGYPDLFLTVTCNPKWPEIQRHMMGSNNHAFYRPDICCRVFQLKLNQIMDDFRNGQFFGKVNAGMYTIEFQKRGLPHAHILLWLDVNAKLHSPRSIDSVICAELPRQELFPKLYAAVANFMIHGPCGYAFTKSPCMKNQRCSKYFPKKFVHRTTFDQSGYPVYRRRDNGVTVMKKEILLDNRSVVPYNPKLLMKYQAHVNIELCNKSNCIKYLFKYINKGVDRVTATLQPNDDECVDEIQQYYDCRYLSPSESIWRIFAYKIHSRWPPVMRLTFHLKGKQRVLFKDSSKLSNVLQRNKEMGTMFLAWMHANKVYHQGRHLTYMHFPSLFTYDADKRVWKPRKSGSSVGRLTYIPPANRELYYMRLLLNVQVGCTSFEDIRTIDKHEFGTYREACSALRLLEDDREFIDGIVEAAVLSSGVSLRRMFAELLMSNSMGDPLRVWEQCWEILSDGILYEKRRLLNDPEFNISPDDLKEFCLVEIDNFLRENGRSLDDYESMPKLKISNDGIFNNILVENEFRYDYCEMKVLHDEHFVNLNVDQTHAYNNIIESVENEVGKMFFVHGYGGTGKTYLWKVLSYKLRSEGKIVVNVASSGIASILLPGGRTAHSQFGLPLVLSKESSCRMEKNSKKAELLKMTSLIIWDEAPMINKWAFEAFDRDLQDIMSEVDVRLSKLPFGGKTIVFGGDFRQILPVVPRGSRADIVYSTINSSYLWRNMNVLTLSQNMRLQFSNDIGQDKSIEEFARWILDIGDGKVGNPVEGEANIEIPSDILIRSVSHPIRDIVFEIYPDLVNKMYETNFFQERAILAPTLEIVDTLNDYVLSMIPTEAKEYLSCDTRCKCDADTGVDSRWITSEFLNEIKCSGLPNHKLILKIGIPVMLLRNIDVSRGLCNGTRLTISHLGQNIIGAKIVTGSNIGEVVYLSRMSLVPSDANVSINFQRRQFPLVVSFAMSINKSQGQTLGNVGLFLPRPVFTHGQLYVVVSRVRTRDGLKILIVDENQQVSTSTVNVVYPEVFQKIFT